MKILLVPVFLLMLVACNSQPRYKAETVELSSVKNTNEGFILNYPKGWDTANLNPNIIFMAYDQRKDSTDKFRENMSIYKVKLEPSMSLDDILMTAEKALIAKYPGVQVLTNKIRQNNHGLKYGLMETLMHHEGADAVNCETYFQRGEYVYILGGAFDNSKYSKYHPAFEKIFGAFRFL